MVPWLERPTVMLDGSRRVSNRFHDLPEEVVASGKQLLATVLKEMPAGSERHASLVRVRTLNRFQAEVEAMSQLVGARWQQLMLANLMYDFALSAFGCSTIAIPTADGPVLARNMDWWPEDVLAQTSYLFRTERAGKLQYCMAGWPGAVGVVSGMSGRGFALVLNAVISPEGFKKSGYPVLLHLRRVLEDARDFADALKRVKQQRLMVGGLVTIVGTDNNERVVIERSPTRAAERWGEPAKALVATNDYRKLYKTVTNDSAEIYQTTCNRYAYLCRELSEPTEHVSVADEQLLYLLTDANVMQGITAQHIVFRPRQQLARVFVPSRLLASTSR